MCDSSWGHIPGRIQAQSHAEILHITQHAQQEMVEEDISLDDLLETISQGQIL